MAAKLGGVPDLSALGKGDEGKLKRATFEALIAHGYLCECGAPIREGIQVFAAWSGLVPVEPKPEEAAVVQERLYCSEECVRYLGALASGIPFDVGFGPRVAHVLGFRRAPVTEWRFATDAT